MLSEHQCIRCGHVMRHNVGRLDHLWKRLIEIYSLGVFSGANVIAWDI